MQTNTSSGTSEEEANLTSMRREQWARRHRWHQRYRDEHNRDPAWIKHSKHILIASWAGRPIYTRYGDESKLAAYMGVITALISNFQRLGDSLREVRAGEWKFVFLCKGPIYLIAISRTSESTALLLHQLHYAHLQILSVLTQSASLILESKPSADIRHLLGGTEPLLGDILSAADTSPYFLLDSIPVLRCKKDVRSAVGSALRRSGAKNLIFGIVMATPPPPSSKSSGGGAGGQQLIHIVRGKDRILHPSDCLLLMYFLSNASRLRTSNESFTPICLPHFSSKGFLYAYIAFLNEEVCLALLTADANDFANLRIAKDKIVEGLNKRHTLTDLSTHILSNGHVIHFDELAADVPASQLAEWRASMGEVRHFLYRSDSHAQAIQCVPLAPYATKHERKWLWRRYQHVLARIGAASAEFATGNEGKNASSSSSSSTTSTSVAVQKKHQLYYDMSDFANILCVYRPGDYVLVITFTLSMTDKALISAAAQRILKWIQKESATLFI